MDHFQLAAIQAVDYFSIFFRQLEIKLYKNKAMNFNLFQSRDSRRFFSRVSVLPELKYIFICRLRDGVVPAVILLSEEIRPFPVLQGQKKGAGIKVYPLIIISSILNAFTACTEWGTFAGMMSI